MSINDNNKRANMELDDEINKRPTLSPAASPTEVPPQLDLSFNPYQDQVGLYVNLKTLYPLLPATPKIGGGAAFMEVGHKQGATKPPCDTAYVAMCDVSDSMSCEQKISHLLASLQAWYQYLVDRQPNAKIAICRFNESASLIYGPGKLPSADEMAEIVRMLTPSGGTKIGNAIKLMNEVTAKCQKDYGGSVVSVLFTDGQDDAFSRDVRLFKENGQDAELTKLGACSGLHNTFLGIGRDADIMTLDLLARVCHGTFAHIQGGQTLGQDIAGVIGSLLGLCEEMMQQAVKLTCTFKTEGALEPTTVVSEKSIAVRICDSPMPTKVPIQLPCSDGPLEVTVKLEVYDLGVLIKDSAPAYTLSKSFTLGTTSEDQEPSMECVVQEAMRIQGIVNEEVAASLIQLNLPAAGTANDGAMTKLKEYMTMSLDEATMAALAKLVEELEVQGAEIVEAIAQGEHATLTRDRAMSRALTHWNGVSLDDPSFESQGQAASRTRTASLAPAVAYVAPASSSPPSSYGLAGGRTGSMCYR
jgi:hypothetical protein